MRLGGWTRRPGGQSWRRGGWTKLQKPFLRDPVDSGAFLRRPRMRNRRQKEFQTSTRDHPQAASRGTTGGLRPPLRHDPNPLRHDPNPLRHDAKKTVKHSAHADRSADFGGNICSGNHLRPFQGVGNKFNLIEKPNYDQSGKENDFKIFK